MRHLTRTKKGIRSQRAWIQLGARYVLAGYVLVFLPRVAEGLEWPFAETIRDVGILVICLAIAYPRLLPRINGGSESGSGGTAADGSER